MQELADQLFRSWSDGKTFPEPADEGGEGDQVQFLGNCCVNWRHDW